MSHFTVLVIGDNVKRQLQPFHEFECTGTDDKFVQDIDKTEEEREDFTSATRSMVRLADGTMVSAHDDVCYRDPTEDEAKKVGFGSGFGGGLAWCSKDWGDGRGYRAKIRYTPEGAEKVDVPFANFAEYLRYAHNDSFVVPFGQGPDLSKSHKYGYALTDEAGEITKVIRRTNPNKRWDWWRVGGRWAGFFKLKPGHFGERGENGLMGSCRNHGEGFADSVRKGAIDIDAMRDAAGAEAGERYDKVHAVIAGRDWIGWEQMRTVEHKGSIEAAREAYWAQPVLVDLKAADVLGWDENLERYRVTREEFVATARAGAIATFAVLKDGQWYERGSMGWFGYAANEKDDGTWAREFGALIDGLPDDTLLTIVDCHI